MASAADRRKSNGGGDGGGANWMDTYGDLVTLLLTFFVLLFAFSNIDSAKWKALVGSFTGMSVISQDPLTPEIAMQRPIEEFGPRGNPPEEEPATGTEADNKTDDDVGPQDQEEPEENTINVSVDKMYKLFDFMLDWVEENDIDADIVLVEDEYSVKMVFNDMIFFRTAEANLLPESIPILQKVITMFEELQESSMYEMIRVEGHTDKRPISTAKYPSNWELSADRALHVLSYMRLNSVLNTSQLSCVGYGEERPLVDEDTMEAYAMNRRVEFCVETVPQVRHPK